MATTGVPGTGQQVLPAVAIYGANASGKSNVIDALAFMRHVVVESHQRWLPDDPIPRRHFRLDEASRAKPSVFVADFVADGVRYEYGFGLTDAAVQEEWLYSWPEHRRRVLFERTADGQIKYGSSFPNRRDHPVGKPRSNSLLLSAAAANEHPLLLSLYRLFRSGLYPALNHTFDSRLSLTMSELIGESSAAALALIRFADLGVEEIRITAPASEHVAQTFSRLQQRPMPPGITGDEAEVLATLMAAFAKITPLIVENYAELDPTSVSLMGRSAAFRLHRDQIYFAEKGDGDGATRLYPLTDFARVRDNWDNLERWYLSSRLGAVPVFRDALLKELAEAVAG